MLLIIAEPLPEPGLDFNIVFGERFYGDRLAHLLGINQAALTPEGQRLARHAIYSTYLDLRELGHGPEALRRIHA